MGALPAYTRRGQPLEGPSSLPSASGQAATYGTDGTFVAWVTASAGVTDHGALTGLADDDHTQYALLAGRAGGQTLVGGTGSGDRLNLNTTSHASKGYVSIDGESNVPLTSARLAVPGGLYVGGTIRCLSTLILNASGRFEWSPTGGAGAVIRTSAAIQHGVGGPVVRGVSGSGNTVETIDQATGGIGLIRSRAENFTTAARPTAGNVGRMIYDTTLNKPLWDDGTQWRDASGAIV